jgi:hypothetical protein
LDSPSKTSLILSIRLSLSHRLMKSRSPCCIKPCFRGDWRSDKEIMINLIPRLRVQLVRKKEAANSPELAAEGSHGNAASFSSRKVPNTLNELNLVKEIVRRPERQSLMLAKILEILPEAEYRLGSQRQTLPNTPKRRYIAPVDYEWEKEVFPSYPASGGYESAYGALIWPPLEAYGVRPLVVIDPVPAYLTSKHKLEWQSNATTIYTYSEEVAEKISRLLNKPRSQVLVLSGFSSPISMDNYFRTLMKESREAWNPTFKMLRDKFRNV